jgi:hypothetical protein
VMYVMHAERVYTPHRLVWQKGSGHLRVTGAPVEVTRTLSVVASFSAAL